MKPEHFFSSCIFFAAASALTEDCALPSSLLSLRRATTQLNMLRDRVPLKPVIQFFSTAGDDTPPLAFFKGRQPTFSKQ